MSLLLLLSLSAVCFECSLFSTWWVKVLFDEACLCFLLFLLMFLKFADASLMLGLLTLCVAMLSLLFPLLLVFVDCGDGSVCHEG